jgi:transposase, IS605 OrfB family, central region
MIEESKKKSRKRAKVPGTYERAYCARCYPTPKQARKLARLFGARRYVYNWALELKQSAYAKDKTNYSFTQLCKELTALKQRPETLWLQSLPNVPLQQALRDLNTAFTRFFKGQARYPQFKRKTYAGSARFQLDQRRAQVDREAGTVQLDGIGKLKFNVTETLEGDLLSATVSRDAAGRWFVSFTADRVVIPQRSPLLPDAIGLDLGVRDLVVTSEGHRTPVSDKLKLKEKRLKRYQRSQSRRLEVAKVKAGLDPKKPIPKGTKLQKSKRFEKHQRRIGKLYAQIRDHRSDLVHQVTTQLVRTYSVIGMETLSVKAMSKGFKNIRRSVANACMGEIRRQLEYKAKWHGCTLIKVSRFYPSSQLCSECGWRYVHLKLSERAWTCQGCGITHDRDVNAARSVLKEALRIAALNPTQYPQVAGNLRAGSVLPEGSSSPSTLGTRNRELMLKPAKPGCTRQACRTQGLTRAA